ncbi:MAG: divalent-cation tolerance protein CutA [Desulfovibrionaceae bacterium]|jgi:periplasmic divalent cation tolerance protein|nr:divalent-cation tolerance protein CutA [Desulfovibrionaceae bacterium]
MTHCIVYMTAASEAEAERICRTLVDARLAACANILGPIRSFFRWKGAVHDEPEIAFIAKTTAERFPALAAEARRLHSYEVPCIVALPLCDGDPDFLAWIAAETGVEAPGAPAAASPETGAPQTDSPQNNAPKE